MKIQRVTCMIGIRYSRESENFNLMHYFGPAEPIPVTEIPLHQAVNGADSVSMVRPFDEYETTRGAEYARLQSRFKKEVVELAYPTALAPFPHTIADVDLDETQIDSHDVTDMGAPVDERTALRKRLTDDLGVKLGFGNYSVERLRKMVAEAEEAAA